MKVNSVSSPYFFKNVKKQENSSLKTNAIKENISDFNDKPHQVSFGYYNDLLFGKKNECKTIKEFLDYNLNFETEQPFDDQAYNELIKKNKSLQNFCSELYSITRSQTYSKGGINTGEFVEILKKQKLKDVDDVFAQIPKNYISIVPDVGRANLEVRQGFFKYLIKELSKVDKNSDFLKIGDELMNEISSSYYKNFDNQFDEYNEYVKSKLQYSNDLPVQKLDLVEEIKKLPQERQCEIEQEFKGDYQRMMRHFIADGCTSTRAPIMYSLGVDTALIQMLPRYFQDRENDIFEVTPLTRRIRVDNLNEFLQQFKEGEIYSYPKTQSFSKSLNSAETWFADSQRNLNVIFRVHPKSKLTKAYDINDIDANKETGYKFYDDMYERYFRSEALYLPNQEFKVLGVSRYIKNNYDPRIRITPDYYKTVIDLQEV